MTNVNGKNNQNTDEAVVNETNWDFLVELINIEKCTPLLSNMMVMDYIFGDWNYVRAWAKEVNYPLTDDRNPAHVAHFLSITSGDELVAKSDYLRFLKESLFKQKSAGEAIDSNPFLEMLHEELPRLTFTQAAMRLGAGDPQQQNDPFTALARLPFPVYLTTSYHTFMEEALTAAGKTPHTVTYNWTDEFDSGSVSTQATQLDFQPTKDDPLVYHFHGLDSDASSLVLTEENYFEFFERMSRDLERSTGLPDVVRHALATSSILLLGFDIQSWPFRVVFRGPIKAIFNRRRPLSICLQLLPNPDAGIVDSAQFRKYLLAYLSGYKFSVHWGDVTSFMQELWSHWEK